jgi:hypothetical protein
MFQEELTEMSDERIYRLCRKFGEQTLYWRKKFIGLLPEVNRRRLYLKKGCSSIFEFAKKLAGLSEEQVRMALNLEKRFEDKPIVREMLVNGEVSINKLARIASVVTAKNEDFWAAQVKLLSQSALETLIRDERKTVNSNGFPKPQMEITSLRAHSNPQSNLIMSNEGNGSQLQLAPDVEQKLLELRQKGIDINELLRTFLQQRELEIARKKEQIANEILEKAANTAGNRHLPAKIKSILFQEHGDKCSIPNCSRPSKQNHHTQRFGLSRNHDPRYIAPLCKEHHLIAHSIDVKCHEYRGYATSAYKQKNAKLTALNSHIPP